jgi:hypothetical protein
MVFIQGAFVNEGGYLYRPRQIVAQQAFQQQMVQQRIQQQAQQQQAVSSYAAPSVSGPSSAPSSSAPSSAAPAAIDPVTGAFIGSLPSGWQPTPVTAPSAFTYYSPLPSSSSSDWVPGSLPGKHRGGQTGNFTPTQQDVSGIVKFGSSLYNNPGAKFLDWLSVSTPKALSSKSPFGLSYSQLIGNAALAPTSIVPILTLFGGGKAAQQLASDVGMGAGGAAVGAFSVFDIPAYPKMFAGTAQTAASLVRNPSGTISAIENAPGGIPFAVGEIAGGLLAGKLIPSVKGVAELEEVKVTPRSSGEWIITGKARNLDLEKWQVEEIARNQPRDFGIRTEFQEGGTSKLMDIYPRNPSKLFTKGKTTLKPQVYEYFTGRTGEVGFSEAKEADIFSTLEPGKLTTPEKATPTTEAFYRFRLAAKGPKASARGSFTGIPRWLTEPLKEGGTGEKITPMKDIMNWDVTNPTKGISFGEEDVQAFKNFVSRTATKEELQRLQRYGITKEELSKEGTISEAKGSMSREGTFAEAKIRGGAISEKTIFAYERQSPFTIPFIEQLREGRSRGNQMPDFWTSLVGGTITDFIRTPRSRQTPIPNILRTPRSRQTPIPVFIRTPRSRPRETPLTTPTTTPLTTQRTTQTPKTIPVQVPALDIPIPEAGNTKKGAFPALYPWYPLPTKRGRKTKSERYWETYFALPNLLKWTFGAPRRRAK